jgi:hypothetical protein
MGSWILALSLLVASLPGIRTSNSALQHAVAVPKGDENGGMNVRI